MRDPATRIDPEFEATIQHAVELLRPFVRSGALRRSDEPINKALRALKSADDGRRRTIAQWEQHLAKHAPKIPSPSSGHPSFYFRRLIIHAVLQETVERGFHLRRNQANYGRHDKRASACSIVSTALYRLGVINLNLVTGLLARPADLCALKNN
jgi:hypothetical protein